MQNETNSENKTLSQDIWTNRLLVIARIVAGCVLLAIEVNKFLGK